MSDWEDFQKLYIIPGLKSTAVKADFAVAVSLSQQSPFVFNRPFCEIYTKSLWLMKDAF